MSADSRMTSTTMAAAFKTKNILFFEQLLKHFEFWDMEVVNLLQHGVPLVGLQPPPEGYQKLLVPASMTEEAKHKAGRSTAYNN